MLFSRELKTKMEALGQEYSALTDRMNALKTEYDELAGHRIELQGAMKLLNDLMFVSDNNDRGDEEADDTQDNSGQRGSNTESGTVQDDEQCEEQLRLC